MARQSWDSGSSCTTSSLQATALQDRPAKQDHRQYLAWRSCWESVLASVLVLVSEWVLVSVSELELVLVSEWVLVWVWVLVLVSELVLVLELELVLVLVWGWESVLVQVTSMAEST
jgi:hypothetical protein